MTPRLVATDLDGTLLRTDGTVSELTRGVLAELDRRDVPVVLVTARPLRWMDELWPMVGRHGFAIVSNGAIWYDVASGTVRELRGIEVEAGLRLCAAIAEAVPDAGFAVECLSGIKLDPRFVDHHEAPPDSPRGPLAEVWTEPAVKVLVQHEGLDPADFRERVIAAVGEAATPTWTGDHLVEISAAGITKAATLARLSDELGVAAEDVIAFGDMPNDIAMLEWAGTSYAVGDADPSVIEAADHVAPSNDDDGVARVLSDTFGLAGWL
jgi:hydroxymethylpyrimidine pyrophosphatase-like HAD family hydrolase